METIRKLTLTGLAALALSFNEANAGRFESREFPIINGTLYKVVTSTYEEPKDIYAYFRNAGKQYEISDGYLRILARRDNNDSKTITVLGAYENKEKRLKPLEHKQTRRNLEKFFKGREKASDVVFR